MHPRNAHTKGYDFEKLTKVTPSLRQFVIKTPTGKDSIDFSNADAVKCLNQALLKHHYKISYWDISKEFLCPPVPGRADYIHAMADLLKIDNQNKIVNNVRALDIGTGANLIYPILGERIYKWSFTASDINPKALQNADEIRDKNGLNTKLVLQRDNDKYFHGVIEQDQTFHITLCNPPFHDSERSANKATQSKWQKLGKKPKTTLNFGGHSPELWCKGGEVLFIKRMIRESKRYSKQCAWFTSLVSKKESLSALKLALKKIDVAEVKVVKMAQGQKTSRFIAWSFQTHSERQAIYNPK
ncbi:23S rRNA (adenine(1618)-N(6))-methyltransferase RlmF [Pseudoalteromonas phenolica]|uniref:Ribosomal RNA large subunit methyltransferase F n=1 Tax=Pseudoalteromonas phenolica TaxID=161398 RepID=A0A0S2K8X8_9GAMM|nr:23S rRNA (adenine(1618)-N(6))-methyltransferase RlmF [Pseudoalteromonas phenolica]ALO44558.1 Ribosomal RNA large subunit methyltransferase F [Pseudoalteromonas phenolica]MBE0357587.1 23S rRNA (adenine1618-N6)-methyltransferase [Pseudoalteromonas phenolica O-BC30]RXF02593.1 23S rRNA (adenine(1618)-N(6))-methyltransferase RlmF [Pseudoalteromonas phenolica O-BC30]TMO52521.1 23S rRNA (adenine(1618)-N(6))-methyltransferase RlmF [Pseudoalteromonas phenolica]